MRNSAYYCLTTSTQFKVFRWPSWLNPIWFKEREAELLEFYGGRDSAGWQHEVSSEHGKPSYGTFNIEYLNFCRQELLEYQKVIITGDELSGCDTEEESHDQACSGEDQFTTHTYTLRNVRAVYSKGNDYIIDAVRCTLLAREQANIDQVGEETVSLVPVLTDPLFI